MGSIGHRLCSPRLVWRSGRLPTQVPRYDVSGRLIWLNAERRHELQWRIHRPPNRSQKVLSDFVAKRQGDRLGVVLFGDHAYLQTPLTADRKTVMQQINQTVIGLVGNSTAIGDGIGLGTKTFVDSDAPQRVMILLSDGSNTSGVLDPIEAAKIAKKYNATIYTVGVGAGEMMVKDFFMTRKVNTASDLDEQTLTKIAEMTGGQYFRARDAKELEKDLRHH